MTTDQQIEAEIQAKGKTAPRITPADIEANIVHTEIIRHVSPTGHVLRWAVLTTRNGFAVTGTPSCSVSSSNDDAEIGEKVAIKNARDALWPLMGYQLRENLYQLQHGPAPSSFADRVRTEKATLDENLRKLQEFSRTHTFASLDVAEIDRLLRQADHMAAYSAVLGERIEAL